MRTFSRVFTRSQGKVEMGFFRRTSGSNQSRQFTSSHGLKKKTTLLALTTAGGCIAYASGDKKSERPVGIVIKPAASNLTQEQINRFPSDDPNLVILKSKTVKALLTVLRDKNTKTELFNTTANRLLRMLAEEALGELTTPLKVVTPCGPFEGLQLPDNSGICGVSIIRSGDILLEQLRRVAPGISVGKILIQRDETHPDKLPVLYYSKLPEDISKKKTVILVDPMLGTAGSATTAIQVLEKAGVKPENIVFINVIACPEGVNRLHAAYPQVKIITCAVDPTLNHQKYIVPGLGDFGDRYYGT